jgi:ligand-binding SRPBCC domain-containing protein
MPDHILERRLWLPRSRPEVFDFFADPRNLARVAPAWAAPAWLAEPPARLEAGALLDFRTRGLLPSRWRVMIREFDPPYRFVDVQLRGPFARWEHRHRFLEGPATDEGPGPPGTWIEDRVTYRMSLGPLGAAVHALVVGRRIAALFALRERRLREIFN